MLAALAEIRKVWHVKCNTPLDLSNNKHDEPREERKSRTNGDKLTFVVVSFAITRCSCKFYENICMYRKHLSDRRDLTHMT